MNEYITGLKVSAFPDLNVTKIEFYTTEREGDSVIEKLINRVYVPTTFLKNFFVLKKSCYKLTKRKEDRSIFS